MNYDAAISHISSDDLKPLYLVYAEEDWLSKDVLGAMKRRIVEAPEHESLQFFTYDVDHDSAERAMTDIASGAFFGDRKFCVVRNLRRTEKAASRDWEQALIAYSQHPSPGTVLAVVLTKPAKPKDVLRTAFEAYGAYITCQKLKRNDMVSRARKYAQNHQKQIESSAAWALERMASSDLTLLHNELDKLIAYTGSRQTISLADVTSVASDAAEIRVFGLSDAITQGQGAQAMDMLTQLLRSGEQPNRIIYFLTGNMRNVARACHLKSSGATNKDIAQVLGLHPFAAQKALQAASRLKPSQIADMYECILWADEAQKSGHDASLALSSMVLELVRFFSRKQ